MRKFKLIKTYPGCLLVIGDIVEWKKAMYSSEISQYYCYLKNLGVNGVNVEDYPEYWEEITDKNEYKVLELSLQRSIKPEIINVSDSGKEYILSLLNCQGNSIHSIKRLSDGEIFTIGDKTHLTNGNYYNFELKEFRFFNNGSSGHLEKYRNKTFLKAGIVSDLHKEPTFFYLEDIVKTKIPLFKTEDEVDIFIGDDYWVYDYGALKGTPSEIHKVNRASQTHTGNDVDRKYFSTKENAEKYVLMNEPCLSVNDVLSIGILKPSEEKITFIEQVKYLVKDRLNGNK
jgi:hypothetical protein